MKRFVALVVLVAFTATGLIQDMAGVSIKDLFASPGSSSSNGSLENLKESSGASQSYQTDLFSGRAQFSIPIFMPPGRRGLTPQTALSYSSSGGNGWLGTGWGLDHGFIQRSTKKGVPSYNNNQDTFTFLVQGVSSDLVQISSNEYHAKDESGEFLKFTFENNTWTVLDKSGTEYTFGSDDMHRMTNARGIFCWCLEKVKDVYGNTIHYSYMMDQGEMYVSRIDYNGNENENFSDTHSVEFILEDRPDVTFSYITGSRVTTAKRLHEIRVKVLGQLSRKYTLVYQPSPQVGRSRLVSIQECGTDGATCLPAQTFEYMNYQPVIESAPQTILIQNGNGSSNNFNSLRYVSGNSLTFADTIDLNGDGLADRVLTPTGAPYDHYRIQLQSSNSTFSGFQNWPVYAPGGDSGRGSISYTNTSYGATQLDTFDLNGDGLSDRIFVEPDWQAVMNWRIEFNSGAGFLPPVTWQVENQLPNYFYHGVIRSTDAAGETYLDLFDVNGDGLPDRIGNSDGQMNRLAIQLNQGNGFGPIQNWQTYHPFDGYSYWKYVRWTNYDVTNVDMLDMNGDGLVDRVYSDWESSFSSWRISFNNGHGFEPLVTWNIENGNSNRREWGVIRQGLNNVTQDLIDMNGDGLPDRVMAKASAPYDVLRVQFNTGSGFSPSVTMNIYNPIPNDPVLGSVHVMQESGALWKAGMIDLSGDGLPDRVRVLDQGAYNEWTISKQTSEAPDLISTIRNGRGGVTTIEYKPSTQFDNRDASGIYRLPFPVNVVSRVTQADGMGNSVVTNYSYKGGMYDAPTREFRGFRETTVTDALGTQTIHTFYQSEHKKGRPEKVEVWAFINDNGNQRLVLFSREENIWGNCADDVLPGVHFVKLTQTDSYLYDGDDTVKHTRKRFEYDLANGNLLRAFDDGDPELASDDRRTENQYTLNESSRILNTVAVTSVYDDQNRKVNEKYFYYDQHANLNDPPEKGALTKSEDWVANDNRPALLMSYDDFGNVETIRDARNFVTQNEYDTTFHLFLVRVTNTLGHTQEFIYNPLIAQITETHDQNGQTARTVYDALGRAVKSISPYDSESVPTKAVIYDDTTFPNRVIVYEKTSTDAPALNMNGAPQSGYRTSYTFIDGLGREIQKRTPAEDAGHQVVSGNATFNERGQIARQYVSYFADFSLTYMNVMSDTLYASNTYDTVGRRVRVDLPDGTYSTVVYDDYVKTVTDANGHSKRYTNNSQGNLEKVEEFNGGETYTTLYYYDALNRLIRTVDHYGHETTVTYDLLGRKTSMSDPNMGEWTYTYDENNNLLTQTDAKNQIITFTYDALNRLTLKTYPSGAQVRYTYDVCPPETCGGLPGENYGTGKLLKVEDASGIQTFRYDKLGRVLQDRKAAGDGQQYSFTRLYDPLGRVSALEYPDGEILTMAFNGMSDVESMTLTSDSTQIPIVANVDYNAANQITKIVYGNGVTTDYTYNRNSMRLEELVTRLMNGPPLQHFNYEFDGVGNVLSITDSKNTNSQEFAYDDLDRLIQASGTSPGSYGTHQFQYDAIGNMTLKNDAVIRYDDPLHPHAATSFANTEESIAYAYDANGNMVTRGNETITFDADNRIKKIERQIPLERTIHLSAGWNDFSLPFASFDPSTGEPISDIQDIFQGLSLGSDYDQVSTLENASWKHLVSDPEFTDFTTLELGKTYRIFVTNPEGFDVTLHGDPAQTETVTVGEYEYDASGARTKKLASGTSSYYLGKDFEVEYSSLRSLTRKAFFLGDTRICERELIESGVPHMRYFHGDHLGSTNLVTNGSGAQSLLMEYLPYGEVKRREGSDPVQNTFTGQKEDLESSLMYYNARYYDPKLGRFVTADSIVGEPSNPQSLNRYSYVDNNPIKYTDPTGHKKKKKGFWSKFFRIAISAIAAAAVFFFTGGNIGAAIGTFAGLNSALADRENGASWGKAIGIGAASAAAGYFGGQVGAGFADAAGASGIYAGAITGAFAGASAGAAGAAAAGGNPVRGGLAGAAGGAAGGAVGSVFGGLAGSFVGGGVSSSVSGGKFISGAVDGVYNSIAITVVSLVGMQSGTTMQQHLENGTLQPGDIYFLTPNGPLSLLVSLIDPGASSHNGIYLGNGKIADSNLLTGGTAVRNFSGDGGIAGRYGWVLSSGNQGAALAQAAGALATNSHSIYALPPFGQVCSTFVNQARSTAGMPVLLGVGPATQFSNHRRETK